ncbi:MAG: 16S rRNA (cytidine(1402)-2'-O)-methyltransferase [Gemmatimonadales bacterium]
MMPLGTLFVVATPLGHMGDLSPRAAETLRTVDTVAAEDTRRTQGLLAAIDAHPRLMSYHAHSTDRRADALLALLADGRDVALVTDAGTPAISDPGVELVAAARAAGIRVVPIPGPSAVATALSAAGMPGDRYLFLGFVPRKGKERRQLLERAAVEQWTVVFFEAPPRTGELLADLALLCGGDRRAVVARELTKLHEELRGGTLAELAAHYESTPPRGEVTVVLAGRGDVAEEPVEVDEAAVRALVLERLAAGESRKDIVRMVAARFNLPRNEAYRLVMDDS